MSVPVLDAPAFDVRARGLEAVLFDVDGVLTNGRVVVDADGRESKQFDIKDGAAIVWAQRAGLIIGLLSARRSPAVEHRARELGIRHVTQGAADKRAAYDALRASLGLEDAAIAYMGDDLVDLGVLSRVGLAAAPADAAAEVRARVHWISRHDGGRGAVREFLQRVLEARGAWTPIVESWLE